MSQVKIASGLCLGSVTKEVTKGVSRFSHLLLCTVLACGVFNSPEVQADSKYASKERSTIAKAHMSRARTLLVEALAEFEEGKKYARPDLLLDSEDWRLRVVSLTEQLNRVIDPKPRITREGAVFRAPPRFVKREKDQLPEVRDGARSRSDHGEKKRLQERQEARARLYEEKNTTTTSEASSVTTTKEQAKDPKNQVATIDELLGDDLEFEDEASPSSANSASKNTAGPAASETTKNTGTQGTAVTQDNEPIFPNEVLPDVSKQGQGAVGRDFSYDKPLQAPPRAAAPNVFEDDFVDTATAKGVTQGDDFDTLPKVITDQEVESISPEVADSRLIDDEELTRRLEKSLSDR